LFGLRLDKIDGPALSGEDHAPGQSRASVEVSEVILILSFEIIMQLPCRM
jgi:hypothetical protein